MSDKRDIYTEVENDIQCYTAKNLNLNKSPFETNQNRKIFVGKYIIHFLKKSGKKYLLRHFMKAYLEHIYRNETFLHKVHLLLTYSSTERLNSNLYCKNYNKNFVISSFFDKKNPKACIRFNPEGAEWYVYKPSTGEFIFTKELTHLPNDLKVDNICTRKKILSILSDDIQF